MAAATRGANCVGIDVNPLALLIVNAKASNVNLTRINKLLGKFDKNSNNVNTSGCFDLEPNRKVSWFSDKIKKELTSLIIFLNKEKLDGSELLLVAAILSATVREVSYCRKNQWKLHRMNLEQRHKYYRSPWLIFKHRLESAYKELKNTPVLNGRCYSILGDAKNLSDLLRKHHEYEPFDIVITSPPYGDSQTTVQYGAMSGLSLGVIRHLKNLPMITMIGHEIDKACLGESASDKFPEQDQNNFNLKNYWQGGIKNPAYGRVLQFLKDVEMCCKEISEIMKDRGRVIYVVARRSAGGWRVYLDNFLIDIMNKNSFSLEHYDERLIDNKLTPFLINKSGKKARMTSNKDYIHTMRNEYILVFKRD